MSKNPLTTDESIAYLNRSKLKTVLIEGKDDSIIYNQIENEIEEIDINIFPCGGRTNLLAIYDRRDEIESELLFICDSDLWVFNKPSFTENNDIITTQGYSIENEIYQDGLVLLNKLLTKDELLRKIKILENVIKWYAFEVNKYLIGDISDCKFSKISLLNDKIIKKNSDYFCSTFLEEKGFKEVEENLISIITTKYQIKLRGKFIFQIFQKIFQERGQNLVKYKTEHLFDLVLKTTLNNDGTILNNRLNEIQLFFK
ncbi:DUF4435 domain-containing protein [Tenacibaculum finnmarkense]|uniref:DUF4435 domain-containing protein n=1 Tax=Tenacibaculum finnmarkense TaxID=2781243 RepID=UPI001E425EB2|nr:DUF4435 domain-containing protein [Tenacibaculum finnmarkense]MCD8445560.1 DUF4435 domain-containing protein [Tenacibaculum finnmarkense genomovar ulcerans]MCD8455202.1 DUF4435 domain-containing protein [Tenacibaculum finnmarkense genomovar ulcerans]